VRHFTRRHALYAFNELLAPCLDALDLAFCGHQAGPMPKPVHLAGELVAEFLEETLAQQLVLPCFSTRVPLRRDGSSVVSSTFPGRARRSNTIEAAVGSIARSARRCRSAWGRAAQPVALRHYRLAGFSFERLMNLLTAGRCDLEIAIRKKPRSDKAARIKVRQSPRSLPSPAKPRRPTLR
jgi:hypothetical protein